ncbi:MAG: 3-hydroxyacyl-ACP dehydratase FabZ family protein [Planctomycetaceae bacterium]|jgi:3-hydroxyacyl-[acyl-carrier-protein] dehydratase
MRWIWIDRFVEFASGSHATAIKCVTMAEEHLADHFPGFPVMPHSLIIEGLAQTGGILVGEALKFSTVVVLAKIPKVSFQGYAHPGDTLSYQVRLLDLQPDGGIVEGTARVGDQLVAEIEIVFASLPRSVVPNARQDFVIPSEMLRILNVGSAPAGQAGEAPAV